MDPRTSIYNTTQKNSDLPQYGKGDKLPSRRVINSVHKSVNELTRTRFNRERTSLPIERFIITTASTAATNYAVGMLAIDDGTVANVDEPPVFTSTEAFNANIVDKTQQFSVGDELICWFDSSSGFWYPLSKNGEEDSSGPPCTDLNNLSQNGNYEGTIVGSAAIAAGSEFDVTVEGNDYTFSAKEDIAAGTDRKLLVSVTNNCKMYIACCSHEQVVCSCTAFDLFSYELSHPQIPSGGGTDDPTISNYVVDYDNQTIAFRWTLNAADAGTMNIAGLRQMIRTYDSLEITSFAISNGTIVADLCGSGLLTSSSNSWNVGDTIDFTFNYYDGFAFDTGGGVLAHVFRLGGYRTNSIDISAFPIDTFQTPMFCQGLGAPIQSDSSIPVLITLPSGTTHTGNLVSRQTQSRDFLFDNGGINSIPLNTEAGDCLANIGCFQIPPVASNLNALLIPYGNWDKNTGTFLLRLFRGTLGATALGGNIADSVEMQVPYTLGFDNDVNCNRQVTFDVTMSFGACDIRIQSNY